MMNTLYLFSYINIYIIKNHTPLNPYDWAVCGFWHGFGVINLELLSVS